MEKMAEILGCDSCKHVLKVNLRGGNSCCGKHEWPDIKEMPENGTDVYVPYKCNDHTTTGADKMTTKEIETQISMQKIHNARTKQAMNNLDNNEKFLTRYGGM